MSEVLRAEGLCLDTPGGRPLIRDLSLSLGRRDRLGRGDRVALVRRNGVGKSSLLRVIAGQESAARGGLYPAGSRVLAPQRLEPGGRGSPGRRAGGSIEPRSDRRPRRDRNGMGSIARDTRPRTRGARPR